MGDSPEGSTMSATVISLADRRQRVEPRGSTSAGERALRAELRRARVRIAQLQASLTEALRDNVAHFERAREAEARLQELLAERDTPAPG
jgi:hypothetical protein